MLTWIGWSVTLRVRTNNVERIISPIGHLIQLYYIPTYLVHSPLFSAVEALPTMGGRRTSPRYNRPNLRAGPTLSVVGDIKEMLNSRLARIAYSLALPVVGLCLKFTED